MSASGLSGDEFVAGAKEKEGKGWYFNFDPDKTLDLLFKYVEGNEADLVTTGKNSFKADGDGSYDILFGWDKKEIGGALTAGQIVVYDIIFNIYGNDLKASWFNFLSQPPTGGNGPFLSTAHVQGIDIGEDNDNDDGSGWIAPTPVPEPATMLLLGSALIGLAGMGRKKFFKR